MDGERPADSGRQSCWSIVMEWRINKLRRRQLSDERWTEIFFFLSMIAMTIDPLLLYIFVIDDTKKYLALDGRLLVTVLILRTISDLVHAFCLFYSGFINPTNPVLGDNIVFGSARLFFQRLRSSYCLLNILLVLPIPEVWTVWFLFVIPNIKGSTSFVTRDLTKIIFVFKLILRIIQVNILGLSFYTRSLSLAQKAPIAMLLNLTFYIMASHIAGASWYFLSIDRKIRCWLEACANNKGCISQFLFHDGALGEKAFLNKFCGIKTPETNSCDLVTHEVSNFDFGIYADALQSGIVSSTDFTKKLSYCCWWGLRHLSSFGADLNTSTFIWEICFAAAVSIVGLILFCYLIGNVQGHLNSIIDLNRMQPMRQKRKELSKLMSMYKIPRKLRREILHFQPYEWQVNSGTTLENSIRYLPEELSRELGKHIKIALLERVKTFDKMDERLRDEVCTRLSFQPHNAGTQFVMPGDKIDRMVFIVGGRVRTYIARDNSSGAQAFNHRTKMKKKKIDLRYGDYFGEQLLEWIRTHGPLESDYPTSDRTIQAITSIEAFVLRASDLKELVMSNLNQFKDLLNFEIPYGQWDRWADPSRDIMAM